MLELPRVTLVIIDSVAHDLARMALEDTLRLIRPGGVLIYSDSGKIVPANYDCELIHAIPRTLREVGQILWYDLPARLNTSHALIIQWDGWPINPTAWDDEFLRYDYIGAPWPWHECCSVGNGGFSLRSVWLMRYVANHRNEFPIGEPEDEVLCRLYRQRLEADGFLWAPEDVAATFSLEHGPVPKSVPFGFHDVRNWARLLPHAVVQRRVAIANKHARKKVGFAEVVSWCARQKVAIDA